MRLDLVILDELPDAQKPILRRVTSQWKSRVGSAWKSTITNYKFAIVP
jgi:hypothetical protein